MTRATDSPVTEAVRVGGILVVSEGAPDAVLIKTLLKEDFENVAVKISPEADMGAAEFLELHPKVLLLAFREIAMAEQCYLGLFRTHIAGSLQPHRTVLLCTKECVKQAFEACRRGLFDDYVLFWPMTYDAPRLRMTVHRALAELAASPDKAPPAMTIAAQACRILELEARLSGQPARVPGDIEPAGNAVARIEHGAGKEPEVLAARVQPIVLVVDDDDFQQKLLSLILLPAGYQVRFASSGTEALEQLSRLPIDLILMDFKLPDMNGIEVTKRLKGDPRLAAIPVIMITGNSERDVVLGSRRTGVADFIVKPVERTVILDKVRRLCSPIGSGNGS
jgi:CheY-like chemotaxis protein